MGKNHTSSTSDLEAQIAALFCAMGLGLLVILLLIIHSAQERKDYLTSHNCVLQNRIFTKKVYCGKACFTDHYLHEYQCSTGRETFIGSPETKVRAKERDDYYTRNKS